MKHLVTNRSCLLLALLVIFSYLSLHATSYDVIVKANVVKGEGMNALQSDPLVLEGIFEPRLKDLGYQTVDVVNDIDNTLFADIFVYQFPADYPTVVITVRSNQGVHYFDRENEKVFISGKAAVEDITARLVERFPSDIDMTSLYRLRVNDVLLGQRISVIGNISNSISNTYRRNYTNGINWPDDGPVPFMFGDWFIYYLSYCVNLQGIKRKLRSERVHFTLSRSCPKFRLKVDDQRRVFTTCRRSLA